jgi:hypothetical protein
MALSKEAALEEALKQATARAAALEAHALVLPISMYHFVLLLLAVLQMLPTFVLCARTGGQRSNPSRRARYAEVSSCSCAA